MGAGSRTPGSKRSVRPDDRWQVTAPGVYLPYGQATAAALKIDGWLEPAGGSHKFFLIFGARFADKPFAGLFVFVATHIGTCGRVPATGTSDDRVGLL